MREASAQERQRERELIQKGIRQIEDQEKFASPRTVLRNGQQLNLLAQLTKLDALKLRLTFMQSSAKGMDRREFLAFLPEVSRLRTDVDTEEQEQALQGLFGIFDGDHDGRVTLKDYVRVLGKLTYGAPEDRLAMGYSLFDPENYGDFSREQLRSVMQALTALLVTPPQLPKSLRSQGVVRSQFIQVHFDTTVVQDQAFTGYSTIQVTSQMNTQKLIKAVVEKKGISLDANNLVLFEIRLVGQMIVYQRKMSSPEKPIDTAERWKVQNTEQFMRFLLVKDTRFVPFDWLFLCLFIYLFGWGWLFCFAYGGFVSFSLLLCPFLLLVPFLLPLPFLFAFSFTVLA